jgi:inhibitor of cysteine peptidase
MIKKMVFWLTIIAVLLAACGIAQTQPSTTGEPKSPATTVVVPGATESLSAPVSNETPAAAESTPSPLDPLPNEENMIRGEAFVESAEVILLESFPVQVNLAVKGTLPTPCHLLRAEVGEPDENGRIDVELYSLTEPGVICIQVLQPFDTTIPLGSYPSGSYTVYVNGEKVGEFDV